MHNFAKYHGSNSSHEVVLQIIQIQHYGASDDGTLQVGKTMYCIFSTNLTTPY